VVVPPKDDLRLFNANPKSEERVYEKRGQTRPGGLALKTMWFCEALLLGDQNLFDGGRSLSQFDILFRNLRRAIRQFHTKIGQVHRSNKADATAMFDGQLTGVAFIALVGRGREDEGTAIRSLQEYPSGHRRGFRGKV
jgi:hypothetical protein